MTDKTEMRIFKFTFKILTCCGCWVPDSWMSPSRRLMYHFYTTVVFLLISTFALFQFLDLILIVDNADEFMDNIYMLLVMLAPCFKMFSLLMNRQNIVVLTDILTKKPCAPIEPFEVEIRQKFDNVIQTNHLHYAILIIFSCAFCNITSLCTDYRKKKLPYRAWLPYDYSTMTLYHITYFHQLISMTIGSILQAACDGLICGLLLHICCQIEILNYRLKKIARDPEALRNCVIQHNFIFKFALLMNKKFGFTITFQLLVSTLAACFNLYQLTKTNTKFVELFLYVFCVLTQIFLYCWYGNEVKLKGLELIYNIFEMEWVALEQSVKKDLMVITRRSMQPIELTSAYVIPVNLESFMTILKTSYSIYNILQQTQRSRV